MSKIPQVDLKQELQEKTGAGDLKVWEAYLQSVALADGGLSSKAPSSVGWIGVYWLHAKYFESGWLEG